MQRKKLTSNNSVNNASTYKTAVIGPGDNTLVLAFVANARPAIPGGTPATPTVSGNGLTWQQVQTVTAANARRLTCYRAMGPTPGAGDITIDFGGQTQDYCAWSIFEYDGVDATGAAGSAAVAQVNQGSVNATMLTVTLGTSADPTRNITVGGVTLDPGSTSVVSVDPGTGFTEIDEQTPSEFLGRGGTLQTEDAVTALSSISWNWTGTKNAAGIAIEIKAAPVPTGQPPAPPDPVEALIRRLEPVLFFHPDESFFPVDTKRYIEHAALWASRSPFDDKNEWGGTAGDPFPREPLVPAGSLAAVQGQGTSWLGKPELLLHDERTERFLELGGWKDKTEAHEAGVTASSSNVYADNAVIAGRYQNDQTLRDSRFWYHAEVFDTDRLLTIASRSASLNLKAIVNRLRNPVLLCYYLFFPAHRQSVSKDYCASITAKEAACHAGDWQCIAVMLDTDGSNTLDTATPKFFGCTGSRPLPVLIDGQYQYRPYEFDAEQLTVMKVEEWRPSSGMTANQPEITEGHPRLYVARGSHSLYTTPGSHGVFPFPDDKQSQWCGNYDTLSLMPPELGEGDLDPLGDIGAFLAKMLIAGQLGPLGWVVGLALAAAEGVLPPDSFGLNIVGTYDPPDPDEAPAAGDGTTVAPAGLTVPDGGADVEPWRARQGLEVNGRTYDFIVKRPVSSQEPNQIWWPSDDRETGFQGRWGQQVTADFLPRRSGPKFPDHVTMFLSALADGDTRGLLNLDA